MKMSDTTRFPHPVLSATTGDYKSGEFSIRLSAAEVPDKAEVALDFEVTLSQPDIHALVISDNASVGIFVNCRETYYSRLVPLGLAGGRFTFEQGALLGRVVVRPMVWTRKAVFGFPVTDCHPEFGTNPLNFASGTVLALDAESVMHVGHDKLAQMESIFTIAKADDLENGTLSVFLESDKIKILVAPDIHDTVNRLRGLAHGKPIVLNSVYLPAVMQVLDNLRDSASTYEGRRWYKVFDAKCSHLGINLLTPDLWKDAQKLLQTPFSEINKSREILDS
jgi:hypothetical protein